MADELEIKPIHRDAIPEALQKAERYRLLNDPAQAESICRDILRLEPGNDSALVLIVLALSDQFTTDRGEKVALAAREYVERLPDEYRRLYYRGLVAERRARALLSRGMTRRFAWDGLREAMALYERAEAVRPPGNDDAILRWNSCVRTIRRENLAPHEEKPEPDLLE
jgi:hypothetical protein